MGDREKDKPQPTCKRRMERTMTSRSRGFTEISQSCFLPTVSLNLSETFGLNVTFQKDAVSPRVEVKTGNKTVDTEATLPWDRGCWTLLCMCGTWDLFWKCALQFVILSSLQGVAWLCFHRTSRPAKIQHTRKHHDWMQIKVHIFRINHASVISGWLQQKKEKKKKSQHRHRKEMNRWLWWTERKLPQEKDMCR